MIFYIILSILLFIIIGYITYKVKYGYWTKQPVFHYHNIFYWYNPPGVIEKGDVQISKYYNSKIFRISVLVRLLIDLIRGVANFTSGGTYVSI